jgi:hypothetical protein
MKFPISVLYKVLYSKSDFRENQDSETCSLLMGVNGILSLLSTFIDYFGQNYVQKTHIKSFSTSVIFKKIGAGKFVILLQA